MLPPGLLHQPRPQPHRTRPIIPHALDTPRLHGLKANDHCTIHDPAFHQRPGQLQTRAARCTGIVRVVDGDVGHAELIEDALAGGGVAIAVAGDAGLDVVVGDVGVEKGFGAGFEAEFGVGAEVAGFDELGEADAEDVGVLLEGHDGLGLCVVLGVEFVSMSSISSDGEVGLDRISSSKACVSRCRDRRQVVAGDVILIYLRLIETLRLLSY